MSIFTGEAALGTPYWWQDAPLAETSSEITSKVDILVIGAGYTGLAAAIAAHDGGASVQVVEAGQVGQGASSRNGGMFGAHPRLPWDKLAEMFSDEVADALFAEASTALEDVRALITREEIDSDLQETGRIQLGWTKAQFENQKQLAARVQEKSRVKVRVIEREGLAQHIATERYFGGILFEEHCAIHPAKFVRGLLEAVQKRGIALAENTSVIALERNAGGFVAHTPKGTITADKVILATNGYTTSPFRWHTKRIFPLPSYIIATEELPSNLIGHIAPGRHMMVETRARHSYFRISPDGKRILWGGRAAMVPMELGRAAERLRGTMGEVWPELKDVKLSHAWMGNTGYSFTHMPHVGQTDGLHHAMGFSGSGTVMAPYLGTKTALQALGDPCGATAYSETVLQTSPLHPFERPYFLQAADRWYRHWVDRWETRAGRTGRKDA